MYRESLEAQCSRCGSADGADQLDISADGPICTRCSLAIQVGAHLGNHGGTADVARAGRSLLVSRYLNHLLIGGIGVVVGIIWTIAGPHLVALAVLGLAASDFLYGLVGLLTKLPPKH